MNKNPSRMHLSIHPNSLNIDMLLRDTFITVLEIRSGNLKDNGVNLYQTAKKQVETVQSTLREAQYSETAISDITYAQCAILDEAVMNSDLSNIGKTAYQTWVGIPLQIHFFNTLEAGEALYEKIQATISQISPDPLVVACFHRVLLLGFSGRYGRDYRHPERLAILERLDNMVKQMGHFPMSHHNELFIGTEQGFLWHLSSRNRWWIGLFFLTIVVYGIWTLFDRQLNKQLERSLPTQDIIALQKEGVTSQLHSSTSIAILKDNPNSEDIKQKQDNTVPSNQDTFTQPLLGVSRNSVASSHPTESENNHVSSEVSEAAATVIIPSKLGGDRD